MFAPLIASAQAKTAASPTNRLAPRRLTLVAQQFGSGTVEQARMLQRNIRNQAALPLLRQQVLSLTGYEPGGDHENAARPGNITGRETTRNGAWDFSKSSIFPRERADRSQPQSSLSAPPLTGGIQLKLAVGRVDDPVEYEADRVAEEIMRTPDPEPSIAARPPKNNRKCSACEEAELMRIPEPKLQRVSPCEPTQTRPMQATDAGETVAPPIVNKVLRSFGQSLDSVTKGFFEPRFGADFGSVRVHADAAAAESARMVNALAYTVGNHVVFANGQYAPETPAGRRLLAHELTHVIQQRDAGPATTLNRQTGNQNGIVGNFVEETKKGLIALGNKPLGPPSGFTKSGCPSTFCQPFADKDEAVADLQKWKLTFGLVIAAKVSSKVLPLWDAYLAGGSDAKDLTAEFGKDFTASQTTAETAEFLRGAVRKDVEAAILAGGQLKATPWTDAALVAINTPNHSDRMNFNTPEEIPGNLAGDFGTDQRAVRIGAKPSTWDDLRVANLTFNLKTNPDRSINVTPSLEFVVQDTIDLCPGNCGTSDEQAATVALSRFEATGLTGDVPFVIRFPAPPEKLAPFVVPAKLGPTP